MKRIKVVHIVEALGGGVYTYFKDLTNFFGTPEIQNQIETIVIYSSNRKEIIPENIKKDFSKGVSLIEINMVRELSLIQDFKSAFSIRRKLKELNPDIVHLHSSKAGVIGRFATAGILKQKQVFYTPHGYSFLRQDISDLKKSIFRKIEIYTQKFFGGVTIACGDTEFEIGKKIGDSRLVRNGIDVNEIYKFHKPVENEKLTIGIVGRITFARNPKLFNSIAEQFPFYNFVWIGDGEFRNEITAKNISVTGWFFNSEEIYDEINKIDVYIQTSLWEGLPIAVLEAMALKKPVVATNVIGNKDVIVHGENGFLFDNPNELKDLFDKLENKVFRKQMGEKAFKRVDSYFNIYRNFYQLIEIYKDEFRLSD